MTRVRVSGGVKNCRVRVSRNALYTHLLSEPQFGMNKRMQVPFVVGLPVAVHKGEEK